jgi:hypothetical protein
MRRVFASLALALSLVGCSAGLGFPTTLLTGSDPNACYAGGEQHVEGQLLVDEEYGTSLDGRPVIWPVGYSGVRLFWGEVQVLDPAGKVVATTGKRYQLRLAAGMAAPQSGLLTDLVETTGAFPTSPCFSEID